MNQLYTALGFILATTKIDAFVPSTINTHHCNPSPLLLQAAEGTDFDAPVLYAPESASGPLDHEIIVDDECYSE